MDNKQLIEALTPLNQKQLIALALKQNEQLKSLDTQQEDIAIIGLHCTTAEANNNEEFWQTLIEKRNVFKDARHARFNQLGVQIDHDNHPQRAYNYQAGLIDGVDQFDPAFFGISPREAQGMDPQQRLMLKSSVCALANAGYEWKSMNNTNTGVFIGVGASEYHLYQDLLNPEEQASHTASGNSIAVIAGRIAYTLGLLGPTLALDTACSSSMVALHLAIQNLQNGTCEQAIVGGVNLILSPSTYLLLCNNQMLSADGLCKTFDKDANGYVRAEAVISFIIKPLSKALSAGDNILACIKGSAINQDGRSAGLTVPSASAQQRVIESALKQAKLTPKDIDYVECHGTGTALGDPIEVQTLAQTFGSSASNPLILGAIKSTIGHTEAAGGLAGLAKAVLALQHNCIPPQANFNQWNPKIHVDPAAVTIPTQAIDWSPDEYHVRRCGISSFGFSGTNAHVIIEEFKPKQASVKQPLPTPSFNEQRIWWSHAVDPINKQSTPPTQIPSDDSTILHGPATVTCVDQAVYQCVAEISGITKNSLDADVSLREVLGFDSIMLSQLQQKLGALLEHTSKDRIPLQIIMDNDTVESLVCALTTNEFRPRTSATASANQNETPNSFTADTRVVAYMQQRGALFTPAKPCRIDRKLVHKSETENVLIADTMPLGDLEFIAEMTQDANHGYFYEHFLDHVPGLYVVEAVRQAATAISHLYLGVDFNHSFVLNDMSVSFSHFVEVDQPAFIHINIIDQTIRDGRIKYLAIDARVIHQGKEVAKITGQGDIATKSEYRQYRGDAIVNNQAPRIVACFDLDGTLTHSHTFWRFLKRCAGTPRFFTSILKTLPMLPAVYRGQKSWLDARERLIESCLKGLSIERIEQVATAFSQDIERHLLRQEALSAVRYHQQQGHETYIISNSAENYLSRLAHSLGMNGVCGSRFEVQNGQLTGQLEGGHCQGDEKVKRINQFILNRESTQIYAYGDSRGDQAMLDWADFSYFKNF